jgi:hypothetical protein
VAALFPAFDIAITGTAPEVVAPPDPADALDVPAEGAAVAPATGAT